MHQSLSFVLHIYFCFFLFFIIFCLIFAISQLLPFDSQQQFQSTSKYNMCSYLIVIAMERLLTLMILYHQLSLSFYRHHHLH